MTEPLEDEKKECVLCGHALAALGILIGVFFLYVGIDVVTNGKLTKALGLGGKETIGEVEE
jgi:uncharacterized membrane protein